ncbi:MAG: enoyl-CoA hydratase [Sphingomonadales bacterium]|nr:enoyl-CoA hydratase [Sphingomonadales bacterium]
MSEFIKIEQQDGVLVVRIDRPSKKNALTLDMYDAITAAFERLSVESELRVMLLTGVEDSFTSGNDIMDFIQNPPTGENSPVMKFLEAISTAEKPIVVAVNGLAIGVGTTMLLHSDLVYAGKKATFQLPFVNLALVPEAASSLILPKMMGHQKAAELLLLGDKFDAEKAESLGVITRTVADDELFDVAMAAAKNLAAKAPEALRLAKGLMKSKTDNIEERMQEEGVIFQKRLTSPEALEAMTAFMERRKPDFSKFD